MSGSPLPGKLERWLAARVEHNPAFLNWLAGKEAAAYDKNLSRIPVHKPVWISGLARAGSTILLEVLATLPHMATHRYRDFPLLHTPLWWQSFVNRAAPDDQRQAEERLHKDGIHITRESPEAFEAMIWPPSPPDPAFAHKLNQHIRKILLARLADAAPQGRYLAKANQHLFHYPWLHQHFPDARLLLPVRHPVAHVASLIKQHKLLCQEQEHQPYVATYMRQTRHTEFGPTRRADGFGQPERAAGIEKLWQSGERQDQIRGWALQWQTAHAYILEKMATSSTLKQAVHVVTYEDLCDAPEPALQAILSHCTLPAPEGWISTQAARLHRPTYYQPDFFPEEIDIIQKETAAAAGRFGYTF